MAQYTPRSTLQFVLFTKKSVRSFFSPRKVYFQSEQKQSPLDEEFQMFFLKRRYFFLIATFMMDIDFGYNMGDIYACKLYFFGEQVEILTWHTEKNQRKLMPDKGNARKFATTKHVSINCFIFNIYCSIYGLFLFHEKMIKV